MCCPWEVCQLNLTKGWKVQDFVGSMSYLNTVKNCDTYPFQKKTLLFKRKLNKVDNAVRKKTTPRGMIRADPELLYQGQYVSPYQQRPCNTYQEQITTQRLTLADPGAIKSQDCSGIVYHCLVSPQSTVERPISTEPGRVKQWSAMGRSPHYSSHRCCKSVSRVYGRR